MALDPTARGLAAVAARRSRAVAADLETASVVLAADIVAASGVAAAALAPVASDVDALKIGQGSGTIVYALRSELFANLTPPDAFKGEVHADPTTAYNGTYKKVGATGTGSWTKVSDLALTVLSGRVTTTETGIATEVTTRSAMLKQRTTTNRKVHLGKNPAGFSAAVIDLDGPQGTELKVKNVRGHLIGKADTSGQSDKSTTLTGWEAISAFRTKSGSTKLSIKDRAGFVRWPKTTTDDGGSSPGGGGTAPTDLDPMFGPELFAVSGWDFELYPYNMWPARRDDRPVRLTVAFQDPSLAGASQAVEGDYAVSVDSKRVYTGVGMGEVRTTRILSPEVPLVARKRLLRTYRATTPLSGSPRILLIGDSLVFYSMGVRMKKRLEAMGLTPIFQGLVGSQGSPNGSGGFNSDGTMGEGRAGSCFGNLLYIIPSTDGTTNWPPVAIGQEATYLATVTTGWRAQWNPFPIPDANVGSPGVYNGYRFDLASYLTRFSQPVPDFIVVEHITNDTRLGSLGVGYVSAAMDYLPGNLRAGAPSAKILFCPPAFARFSSGSRWTSHVQGIQRMIDWANNDADANMHLVSSFAHMDPENGYPLEDGVTPGTEVAPDPVTGVATGELKDGVHLGAGVGIDQLPASVAYAIANLL